MTVSPLSSIRSVADLLAALDAGAQPKFLFFWGHTAAPDAPLGKECFSQWYPAGFEENGMLYPTAEHYLMAEKARIFGDEKARAAIIKATHPNEAKRLGREIAAFDESVWQQVRTDVVVRGNLLKFTQHPTLATFLTQTGSRILVKASPLNSIWGIGLSQDHPQAAHPAEWSGLNLSGFALMRVRQLLA